MSYRLIPFALALVLFLPPLAWADITGQARGPATAQDFQKGMAAAERGGYATAQLAEPRRLSIKALSAGFDVGLAGAYSRKCKIVGVKHGRVIAMMKNAQITEKYPKFNKWFTEGQTRGIRQGMRRIAPGCRNINAALIRKITKSANETLDQFIREGGVPALPRAEWDAVYKKGMAGFPY